MSEREAIDALVAYGLKWDSSHESLYSESSARIIADEGRLVLGLEHDRLEILAFCLGSSPWFRGANLMETGFLDFMRLINPVCLMNWLWTFDGALCVNFGIMFSNEDLFHSENQDDNEYGDQPRIISVFSRQRTIELIQESMSEFQTLVDEMKKQSGNGLAGTSGD